MQRRSHKPRRTRPTACGLAAALAALLLAAGAAGAPNPAPDGPSESAPDAAAGQAAAPAGAETTDLAATPQAALTTNGGIELHVNSQELTTVIGMLSRRYQLNIVCSKSAKGKVTADLYGVTVDEAIDAICRGLGFKWMREGDFIFIHTPQEMTDILKDADRLVTEVFHLNYLTAEEAVTLIKPALSDKATTAQTSASEVGIPSGGDEAGGDDYGLPDTIIVHDFPENIEDVREIIKKMDRRPRQVLVEATILAVTLNDRTSLGINFNTLAGVDFHDLAIPPTPTTAPATISTLASQTGRAGEGAWGNVFTDGFATPGTGLNIGVITDSVTMFINALEEITDTTVLSNPKVLTLNKHRAEVNVGDQIGYRGEVTQTETAETQDAEFLDVGTVLRFRPFISDEGFVRMEVHPEVSQRGAETIDGVPSKATTQVTCNIMVKDGRTIVIGGLFDETVTIGRRQVPGLGSIPGLGWIFRDRNEDTLRREIIILITPHIIDDEEAYQVGEQLRDDAERRCIGMREGFHWLTRERLTTAYLQAAERDWRRFETTGERGRLHWALWNLNLTLYHAPNNLQARRLKDNVLSEMEGRPTRQKPWTIWDSVREHMNNIDRTRGLGPYQRTYPRGTEPPPRRPAAERPPRPSVWGTPEPPPTPAATASTADAPETAIETSTGRATPPIRVPARDKERSHDTN